MAAAVDDDMWSMTSVTATLKNTANPKDVFIQVVAAAEDVIMMIVENFGFCLCCLYHC